MYAIKFRFRPHTQRVTGIVVTSVSPRESLRREINGLVFDRLGGGVNGRRPEGAGRGAFYSAGGTARRSFAIDLKRISKRERETLAFLGSVVEPSSARRRLIKK